ncbi:hypothetical protein CEXT_638221 [Caerostris extrusa]|uniref:Uncharacterized protein n=1 Tax=Caerostris extrusa TaxID=172846 RepID=A0AAV4XEQ6_CAEEX|nr:hypothetical protein CEXT_638221 [Caerostris extrusa]
MSSLITSCQKSTSNQKNNNAPSLKAEEISCITLTRSRDEFIARKHDGFVWTISRAVGKSARLQRFRRFIMIQRLCQIVFHLSKLSVPTIFTFKTFWQW